MVELRGLGDVHRKLSAAGGTVLGIVADPVDKCRKVVEDNDLAFDILSDEGLEAIRSYGIVFHDPFGHGDIALPANFLIDRDGRIVWEWIAPRFQDRVRPEQVMEEVRKITS